VSTARTHGEEDGVRGLVLEDVGTIVHRDDLPDPTIEDPTDAIVRVDRAGLCGSDMHPYAGREAVRFGVIPGHEVVGEVVAAGPAVTTVHLGDRVLVPFTTSCGDCGRCRSGLSSRCVHGQLFGFGPAHDPTAPALHGGQAELVRVPLADGTLVPVPRGIDELAALLLCDNLPTGWFAVERAGVATDRPAAVLGLGAVGLCAVLAARTAGATPVLAVDPVAGRRERAAALGATALHPDEVADAVDALDPPGLHHVVDAAGTREAQGQAVSLLAPGGTLSVIAVPTDERFGFAPTDAYDTNLTVRAGRAPVRSMLDRLLPRVVAGEVQVPTELVLTHPAVALADGARAYERFAVREPGMVKVAFVP
jgi:alcohol dehydrogenase